MPTFLCFGRKVKFAGRDEVLEFCQRVRKAGGANALDALLPGKTGVTKRCLIARNLNFDCEVVRVREKGYADGSLKWAMIVPDKATARRVAKALGARTVRLNRDYHRSLSGEHLAIRLPKSIGNAAYAFDGGSPEFRGLRL